MESYDTTQGGEDGPAACEEHLGRYVILERIGEGGMGVVYRAYDPRLRREVALKRLRPKRDDPIARERLAREAQALARLSHPHVVSVFDVEEVQRGLVMAMEYVEGLTLRDWSRVRRRSLREVLHVMHQAGRGLSAAHAAGFIHRDFKPSNVLVGTDGRVRVMDFGLVRPSTSDSWVDPEVPRSDFTTTIDLQTGSGVLTEVGAVVGTPAYMAPEQHLGDRPDAKSDQYAFCLSLWEALTGRRPFRGTRRELLSAKLDGPPPWPASHPVPRRIVRAIVRGLSPASKDRWDSMDEVLAELERVPDRWKRSGAMLGAASVLLLGGGTLLGHWRATANRCEGGSSSGVWDDERRDVVRRAILSTGMVFADETWLRLEHLLDDYSERWSRAYGEVCDQSSDEGAGALLDLQMSCLQQRQGELAALVELLEVPDSQTVQKAVPMAARLSSVERCRDIAALTADIAPPEDPDVARTVTKLRESLAHTQALFNSGHLRLAGHELETLRTRAESVDYPPVRLEFAYREATIGRKLGETARARVLLNEVYDGAVALNHRSLALNAAIAAAESDMLDQHELRRAEAWATQALAWARRIRERSPEEAHALGVFGMLRRHQSRFEDALAYYAQALEIAEESLGPTHPDTAVHVNNLANVYVQLDRFELAEKMYRRTLEIWRDSLGPHHPNMAAPLSNLSRLYEALGRHETAMEYETQALEITRAAFGPEHESVAQHYMHLGTSAQHLGRSDEALDWGRKSLDILQRIDRPDSWRVAIARVNFGSILVSAGEFEDAERELLAAAKVLEDYGDAAQQALANLHNVLGYAYQAQSRAELAEQSFQRALGIFEATVGPLNVNRAATLNNLAGTVRRRGQAEKALSLHREALQIQEALLGPTHAFTAHALVGLGHALVDLGRASDALPSLERALAIRREGDASPAELGDAEFALARAAHALGSTARARVLARKAREHFAEAGLAGRPGALELSTWFDSSDMRRH